MARIQTAKLSTKLSAQKPLCTFLDRNENITTRFVRIQYEDRPRAERSETFYLPCFAKPSPPPPVNFDTVFLHEAADAYGCSHGTRRHSRRNFLFPW